MPTSRIPPLGKKTFVNDKNCGTLFKKTIYPVKSDFFFLSRNPHISEALVAGWRCPKVTLSDECLTWNSLVLLTSNALLLMMI